MINTSLKQIQTGMRRKTEVGCPRCRVRLGYAPSWHAYKYKKIQTQKNTNTNTNTKNTITKTEVGCPRSRVRLGYAPSWHAYKLPLVRC